MNIDSLYTTKENFIIVLDSRNADQYLNGSNNSSIKFNLSEPIRRPRTAISMMCSVLQFQAPNSLYNINKYNNTIRINRETIQGEPSTLYYNDYLIPEGNYNCNTLMNYINANILPNNLVVTFDAIKNKYSMTMNEYFNITGSLGEIMGWDASQVYTSNVNNLIILPFTCNFNGLQSFNIHFNSIITKNINSFNDSYSSIVQSIPIDGSAKISYIKNADFNIIVHNEMINEIQIDLRDDLNRLLNFNNQHWNLTLYFSIIQDIDRFQYLDTFNSILRPNILHSRDYY